MNRIKKLQKPEDSISFYRNGEFDDNTDAFSIYGSPLMTSSLQYSPMIQSPNYMMGSPFGLSNSPPMMDCSPSYPLRMMGHNLYANEPSKPEERKSANKHLTAKSSSFNLPISEVALPNHNASEQENQVKTRCLQPQNFLQWFH